MALAATAIDTRLPLIAAHGEQYMPPMACPWWHWVWRTTALGGMELDDITLDGMAWHWAAVVIDARHPPIAAASMLPNACHPNAMDGQYIPPMLYPPMPCRPHPANPMPL
jgi:hypothetical protein